jgi:Lon-like protease
MVTAPVEARLPSGAHRLWAYPVAGIALVVVAAVLLAALVPATTFVHERRCVAAERRDDGVVCTEFADEEGVQFATVPADAEPVGPRMTITGTDQYPSTGEIYFVTVSAPELSLLDWFVVRHNPAANTLTYTEKYGDNTPDEQREQGFQMMRDAKQIAEYVALSRAGVAGVSLDPGPAVIGSLCLEFAADGRCSRRAPAADVLEPGDRIIAVDDEQVDVLDDLAGILDERSPGDVVAVTFVRGDEEQTADVTTVESSDTPGRTIIGFIPADTRQIRLPEDVTVEIDTSRIGGPSAGAAFTLTLLDELTPGDLLGGGKVAVTGTIDVDQNIGAIGGLRSKASAVQQVGVKYFLVPASQGEADIAAAQAVVGNDVQLIPVATIDEALAALARLGGDALPTPSSTTTTP